MIRFARAFPGAEIVSALQRQLSSSHFRQLIYMEDELKRTFYAEMCRVKGWSTRVLAERIDGMLFERTALSKKPEALIRKELAALHERGELSPALVFRDPYMLDFLELADTYSEKDLESATLREIERFLLPDAHRDGQAQGAEEVTTALSPIIVSRLEKAATYNGFDQELEREGHRLVFASTLERAPSHVREAGRRAAKDHGGPRSCS
ncbi:DUF1016 N-terminal domain-containing protein [Sorangium sp. So ce448]|uniref:DUF1016 N-terminal domain-containing protein n=1 Tax=Sorangium sp. So ce448 TaxID=3133314 RepID=UPI003F5E9F3A